ncbi:MAG: hypothetical protein OIF58_14905 [Cohaesibacter sp.]|nr:hypothetical protein [Cohaesibacter sp.]
MPSGFSLQISSLILLIGLICQTADHSHANDGISYWVSRNFQESPNVNLPPTEQRWVRSSISPKSVFAPQIADLSQMGIKSGKLENSELRLCFDNRSILYAGGKKLNLIKNEDGYHSKHFCEFYDEESGVGFYKHTGRNSTRSSVTKGLLVSRQPDGRITCEAIFTQVSLFELLIHKNSDQLIASKDELRPYGLGMTFFSSEKIFFDLLDKKDQVMKHSSILDGSAIIVPILMDNTWKCLAPQFRKYWNTTIQNCSKYSKALIRRKGSQSVYVPILAQMKDEIIQNSNKCLNQQY